MAKHKVTYEQLKATVQARRTKGSAFSLDYKAYTELQSKVKAELDALSFSEIVEKYPEYTYDMN